VEPKVVHRFDKAGEYVLHVRDITSRYGDPAYRYRIFVRPQIPHVGEVSLGDVDRVNLVRGGAGRVTFKTTYEEGFTGDVTFLFHGLPDGVQAFPSSPFVEKKDPTEITENPKTVLAPTNETTIVLAVSPDAPLTHLPRIVRIECRVLAQGKLGPALLVREIPVMVVAENEEKQEAKDHTRL
jgi:hypothetical protein